MRTPQLSTINTAPASPAPSILWRGSWQSVNIGDIGHTPGALELLQKYLPAAHVTLWPGELGNGSREFLQRRFPQLKIAENCCRDDNGSADQLDGSFRPRVPALAAAWERDDIMIHGSGSGFGARAHLDAWQRATGKPSGAVGISFDPVSGFGPGLDPGGGTLLEIKKRIDALPRAHIDGDARRIMDNAAFIFARDSLTLDYLRGQGIRTPVLEFGPDSQFGMTLRDDARGDAYRHANGLDAKKYLCVIPRLRYTPYYKLYNTGRNGHDDERDAINDRTTERDHEKLRALITAYVRQTGNRVMTCPEMTYQSELARRVLIEPLPSDVRKQIVWRDTYWLPDEAASIYANAQAVVSYDCHSPIIALTHGTPAFYVRQPTDTCKGQMYRDLGLDEWFFEIDETDGAQLWSRLEKVLGNSQASRAYLDAAMERVRTAQARMMQVIKESIR